MKLESISSRCLLPIAAALAVAAAGCNPGRVSPRHLGDGGGIDQPDADGDGIWDAWEDAREGVDTDADGTPDFQDDDSDGDGVPDSIEGRANPATGEPADSDGDGTYDFRDDDSDGNGILDADEPDADIDGDGIGAYADLDDDGDAINDTVEMGGDPNVPVDTDGDGAPDYQDIDSDGDNISDRNESVLDSDRDGTPDRFDADSDDDGTTDLDEAGDADPNTPPIDSDSDGAPNFRDTDSDDDGLSDADERAQGTNPTAADSDGDGVSDLVEIAACPAGDATCSGDATDAASSPRTRGDFVFFEPYEMPPMPTRDTLDFATDIRVADVYFLIDTTGSMGGVIDNVQRGLSMAGSGIIDRVRATIPDTFFGVGDFRDAYDSFPSSSNLLYRNVTDMTASASTAQAGVDALAAGGGGDGPEGDVPALYATASGMGVSGYFGARTGCPAGTFGYPCFRSGAVPIVVLITDAPFHNGPASGNSYPYTTYPTALTALTSAHIRVIGISVGAHGGTADLQQTARDTGAVDAGGTPLVSVTSDVSTVSSNVVSQIQTLASATSFDISVQYQDDASDAVDSFAAFVDHVEANEAGDTARGCAARAGMDTDGDGHPDMFLDVPAGERVCFDIIVKQNDTVMPTDMPQLFRATLRVLGDGFTELDSRDVYFLVPGTVAGPGGLN